jgi:hypothetical protein
MYGRTALLMACQHCYSDTYYPLILWLLDKGGARISETDLGGNCFWDFLKVHVREVDHDVAELASLLRVLCLL